MVNKPTYEELEQRVKELENETFERKQAEDALRELTLSQFRATLEATVDGIIVVGLDSEARVFSKRFKKIWHMPDSVLDSEDANQVLDYMLDQMNEPEVFSQKVQTVFADPNSKTFDTLHLKDGRILEVYSRPQKLEDKMIGRVWGFRDVTKPKQAIMEQQKAQSRLQALSDASFEAIFFSDQGICIDQNSAAERMFGYSHKEAIGRNGTEWIVPEDRERVKNNMLAGYEKHYEVTALRKDGSTFPAEIQGHMFNFMGKPTQVTVLQDNSVQQQARETLRESENRFRLFMNHFPGVAFINDPCKSMIYVNSHMSNFYGLKPEEIIGLKFEEYIPPDFLTKMNEQDKIVISENRFLEIEETVQDVSGPREWWTCKFPIHQQDKPTLVGGLGIEITERKQAEQALREGERKYRRIFENIQDVYYESSLEGTILEISPSIENVSQYKRKDLIGRSLYDIYTNPEERDGLLKLILDKGKVNEFEMSLTDKDGSQHPCSITTLLVKDEQNNPIKLVGSMRDISERKQNEEERKKLKAQLQQALKMEAMGTLAGGIAHDFNNLLMAIQGRTSIMLMKKDSSHPDIRHLKGIEDNVESAADLTRQLLGFARGGRYEVKSTDLNELIKKQNRMFGRTKKEIAIRGKYQENLWSVEVDQGQIAQVLLNLYVNAWQAMPAGGDLYLGTENVTLDENYVKPFSIEPGKYVKISVTDTGTGMDKSTRERIFEPFFTTKEMGRGTGLGLASAYGIIKNHSGFINVYSEKGHGTTFNIYLPASEKEIIEEKKLAGDTLRGTETVLFVDDEDMIIEVAGELFQQLGYRVLTAKNGKDAIEIYEENKEHIDIVLLDMIMPDMSGSDTYDKMKKIDPDIKVLLSSGYSINGQATEIMDRGCNGFIQKPFKMKELSRKLREILDEK